jgi:hypothetical protein
MELIDEVNMFKLFVALLTDDVKLLNEDVVTQLPVLEFTDELNVFKLLVVLLTEEVNELIDEVKALNEDVVPNPNEVIALLFQFEPLNVNTSFV